MNKKNTTDKELREKLKAELKEELLQEMKEELLEEKAKEEKVEVKKEKTEVKNVKKETKPVTKDDPHKNKDIDTLDNVQYNILWEGKPCGLLQRFLTKIHLNFTTYQITKDELIVITGFFKRRLNSCELYLLKDPDLTDNIYQRLLNISTISVRVDTHVQGTPTRIIRLKNIEEGSKVRKLLRDAIEADVMERKITYFDKV